MSAVTKITPHLTGIKAPSQIANLPIWLIWRLETVEGESKPRKVPYYANGSRRHGVQGRPEDRNQLVTFEAARAAAARKGFTGVGHACLDGVFTVIDFDKCAPGGRLDPRIEAMAANTYAEYSPSGEGIHLYIKGNLRSSNAKSIATKDQFGIELFSTKGFCTFTGDTLEVVEMTGNSETIGDPSPELQQLITSRFGADTDDFSQIASQQEPLGVPEPLILEALEVLDPDVGHENWLRIGMAIHHETGGEGFHLWDSWSSGGIKYPGSEALQARWDSFGRNPSRQVTIRSLVQLANQQGARITLNAISMEEFEDLGAQEPAESETVVSTRFPVKPWHEFAVLTDQQYLIKGLIPKAALGVLFGEAGSGKSFITLDMALAVAQGAPWRGLRTDKGRVVYLVAEGAAGFRNRLLAHAKRHSLTGKDCALDIIDATPNLLLKEDALDICKAILSTGPRPALVIVDTFAQAMAGANENASEDMGKALANCKGIHKATGAMVLLVHHSGKDASRGARGWSGLRAAADVELEVIRSSTGRYLKTTKQKDGLDFGEWGFGLEVVTLGEDKDGDPITSCVVIEADVPGKAKQLGVNEQAILDAIADLGLKHSRVIDREALIAQAMLSFPGEEDPTQKKKNLRRTLKAMAERENSSVQMNGEREILLVAESE